MSIKREVSYREPIVGRDRSAMVTIDVEDVDVDGATKPCLVARSSGRSPAAFDATDLISAAIDGRFSGMFADRVGSHLAAKWTTGATITVDDDDGFVAGDPIAVFNSEGGTPEYRLVSGTPAANVITMNAALSSGPYYEGAYVVNLSGLEFAAGRGYNRRQGVRAQLEAPSPVTISVADAAANTIDVTITPNDEDTAVYFDIYIRSAAFTRIEPNWRPDVINVSSVASASNANTFGGGADCVPDGSGGSLVTLTSYWVAVVAKDASGLHDVRESAISNIVKHTLD